MQLWRTSIIGLLITIFACQAKHVAVDKCSSVRNAKFVHYKYDDGTHRLGHGKLSTFITRNDSFITYTIQPIGITHTYKIEWINSCEYKLARLTPMSWSDSLSQRFAPYSHKIIKVDKNYILEYASTMIDTLWIDN
jgi:hypothetical protein